MSDYLAPEIVTVILLRLPSKSLIRFTLVSKSWYSLITSQSFIRSHLHLRTTTTAAKNTSLLLRTFNNNNEEEHYTLYPEPDQKTDPTLYAHSLRQSPLVFSPPIKTRVGYYRIVGSYDGLVCLFNDYFSDDHTTVLWNPSIHKHVTLPLPTIRSTVPHMVVLGFGRDLLTHDYKVVRLLYDKKDGFCNEFHRLPQVEVYSLEKRAWHKIINQGIKCKIMQLVWSHTFVNGSSYWIAFTDEPTHKNLILSFDFHNEMFHEILFPETLTRVPPRHLTVTVYKKSLAVFQYHLETYKIWVMKKDGILNSWINLFNVDLIKGTGNIVGSSMNGEIFMVKGDKELVLYDPETGNFIDLDIYGSGRAFQAEKYVESLVLLKARDEFLVEEL